MMSLLVVCAIILWIVTYYSQVLMGFFRKTSNTLKYELPSNVDIASPGKQFNSAAIDIARAARLTVRILYVDEISIADFQKQYNDFQKAQSYFSIPDLIVFHVGTMISDTPRDLLKPTVSIRHFLSPRVTDQIEYSNIQVVHDRFHMFDSTKFTAVYARDHKELRTVEKSNKTTSNAKKSYVISVTSSNYTFQMAHIWHNAFLNEIAIKPTLPIEETKVHLVSLTSIELSESSLRTQLNSGTDEKISSNSKFKKIEFSSKRYVYMFYGANYEIKDEAMFQNMSSLSICPMKWNDVVG